MTLLKPTLKASILDVLQQMASETNPEASPQEQMNTFAEKLSTAIDSYIKSATVTIPTGACIVVGSPTTQTNPAPIFGNLT